MESTKKSLRYELWKHKAPGALEEGAEEREPRRTQHRVQSPLGWSLPTPRLFIWLLDAARWLDGEWQGGQYRRKGPASLLHGQWPIRVSQYTQRQFQFKASWA